MSYWGPSGTSYLLKTSQNCSKMAHFSFISVRMHRVSSWTHSLVSGDAGSLPKPSHSIWQEIGTRISTFIFILSELEQFPWARSLSLVSLVRAWSRWIVYPGGHLWHQDWPLIGPHWSCDLNTCPPNLYIVQCLVARRHSSDKGD